MSNVLLMSPERRAPVTVETVSQLPAILRDLGAYIFVEVKENDEISHTGPEPGME